MITLLKYVTSTLVASALITGGNAFAATSQTDDLSAYFRVLWGLLLVLALILALYALFRKRFSIVSASGDKAIKVLEIQPLMPRKSLCLIEVRGKEYLIGVGQEEITLLADLSLKPSFKDTLEKTTGDLQP